MVVGAHGRLTGCSSNPLFQLQLANQRARGRFKTHISVLPAGALGIKPHPGATPDYTTSADRHRERIPTASAVAGWSIYTREPTAFADTSPACLPSTKPSTGTQSVGGSRASVASRDCERETSRGCRTGRPCFRGCCQGSTLGCTSSTRLCTRGNWSGNCFVLEAEPKKSRQQIVRLRVRQPDG